MVTYLLLSAIFADYHRLDGLDCSILRERARAVATQDVDVMKRELTTLASTLATQPLTQSELDFINKTVEVYHRPANPPAPTWTWHDVEIKGVMCKVWGIKNANGKVDYYLSHQSDGVRKLLEEPKPVQEVPVYQYVLPQTNYVQQQPVFQIPQTYISPYPAGGCINGSCLK